MSDALKSNTTLTALNLEGEHKRNNTQMISINNPLFSIHIKSIGNKIGETGTTSLSDALKSNTTLIELNLSGENKRNNTQMISTNNPFFFIIIISTDNAIGERGATSLSDALKSNTTLTKLDLSCEQKTTQIVSINKPLFSIHINSTDNSIGEAGRASLSDALKSNTTLTTLLRCK